MFSKYKKPFLAGAAMIIVAGLICSCNPPKPTAEEISFGDIAWEESLKPVHPGVPGKVPFWNQHAERFIYAPAFDYQELAGADHYLFELRSLRNDSSYRFKSDVPYSSVSPVWGDIPVGKFEIRVTGVSGKGDSLGLAGEGSYYRAAPFDGIYHQPVLPYDQSARTALDSLMHKDYVNYWLRYKRPDPDYVNYRYPAKIMSALIVGAVTHARLKPDTEDAQRSTLLARIIADYMIRISYPESSVWPDFPPTYHGPRIGKKPDSHMQLVNCLTIMGADAGHAYLDLYDLTGEEKYLEAARKIARTYVKNQMNKGTWYLYVNHESGEPLDVNLAIPTAVINYFERLSRDYHMQGLESSANKALNWLMNNPVKTFDWQAQFEDVKTYPPFKRLSREQACDLAIYLFRKKENLDLAEELVRFSEDQFVIWEQPDEDYAVKDHPNPGWHAKNWITPCVMEQYGFWMPVNRSAGIMLQTFWEAYAATQKEIYLAKAKSIANSITVVQEANNGDYPTMFIATPWNLWLNSTVYPAKIMMDFEQHLKQLNSSSADQ